MSFKKLGELTIDETPVANSNNLIISGAVANLSNPNILINGDFRINQRGLTTYSGANEYTADRWQQGSGSFDYSTKTWTPDTQYSGFVQKIEDIDKLKGQTVTISAKINSVSNTSGFDLLINDGSNHRSGTTFTGAGIRSYTYTISASATQVRFGFIYLGTATTDTLSFEWVKVEFGSVATPFSPRPYAEELAMCQRYYWKSTSSLGSSYYGYSLGSSSIRAIITMPQVMRTAPTISSLNESDIQIVGAGQQLTPTAYSYQQYSSNGTVPQITYDFTCSNSSSQAYIVRLLQEFSLDAEIY